ncbi:MAG: PAS domain S-box protein [Desulfobacteraceae bacterium]|nr:PAS domain S-box protein [Desulfobacteraceae bacterium]
MNTIKPKNTDDYQEGIVEALNGANVGIVGGGSFCRKLIQFFFENNKIDKNPNIIGVADINAQAPGFLYARELGIFTTSNYEEFYDMPSIQVILEITHNDDLAAVIKRDIPGRIKLVDHFHARYLWDLIRVENIKRNILEKFKDKKNDPEAVESLFHESFDYLKNIMEHRNKRSRQIELELVENQKTQAQIIQGSTIPTFVINKDHVVTHWNIALEKLSGWKAKDVVGTNRQWAPFWDLERPTMADVILDQIEEGEIEKLYGSQWRKSSLIEGGYEAEVFFPHVGGSGKWLWFTAAPIKAPDGIIMGAIETLWDKTEDRRSQEERERHTRELGALCSIYTALSAPWHIDYRIEAALKEVQHFLYADDICIYLCKKQDRCFLRYHYGKFASSAVHSRKDEDFEVINQIINTGEMVLIESIDHESHPELAWLAEQGFQSAALIPISAKEKKTIGVLQIASKSHIRFASDTRHMLELIGNRIGAAIENATLQEQYIKSEEKYRSLFNSDPNPIFIVDKNNLEILDINERAHECYGYLREELVGMNFAHLGDSNIQELKAALAKVRLGQSILFTKKQHFRKGKTPFFVNINIGHAQYGEGEVFIATTTDITETVEKETQLIQASKMTTLGVMAAGMAHEINQPLNVIQICGDFLLKAIKKGLSLGEEDLRNMANDIISNVERATGIIRHVRDFARQSEVLKRKVNINAPVQDVFKVLGHQIKAHQIELDLNLDPEIPFIMADHNRLEQVFINLVTNAIDAMDEKANLPEHKSMTKTLNIKSFLEDEKVVVKVQDNGMGISKEVRDKIFEPFFTTKKVGKGTGLGVSISYSIVKDYDGTIAIESKKGQGATFILKFPAADNVT